MSFEKRAGGWLSGAGGALVSVFFPAGCRLCERILVHARTVPICEECLGAFPALGGAMCEKCGQPLSAWSLSGSGADRVVCPECRSRAYAFDRARSYALYKSNL